MWGAGWSVESRKREGGLAATSETGGPQPSHLTSHPPAAATENSLGRRQTEATFAPTPVAVRGCLAMAFGPPSGLIGGFCRLAAAPLWTICVLRQSHDMPFFCPEHDFHRLGRFLACTEDGKELWMNPMVT